MIGSAIAGGFVGTLVMTAMMRGASEMGLTRIDFALLLGTTVSDNRTKARAVGYVFHVVLGIPTRSERDMSGYRHRVAV